MPIVESVTLDGFTSSSTGEQLFTLSGSVQGSLSGLLEVSGTDLDLIDEVAVTGSQYSSVQVGDLVKSADSILAPIEITSTANGGFTLQIGDAVVTVAVTYVAPVPVISSVYFDGERAVQDGVHYRVIRTVTAESLRDFQESDVTVALQINGENLNTSPTSDAAKTYFRDGSYLHDVVGTVDVNVSSSSHFDAAVNFPEGATIEGGVQAGDYLYMEVQISGLAGSSGTVYVVLILEAE